MAPNSWQRSIHSTIAEITQEYNIQLIIKSHSFRVGFVTRNLKRNDIEWMAHIIGHKSLNSTRR